MSEPTVTAPNCATLTRLDRLGLSVTGQQILPHTAILHCAIDEADDWCHACGCQGRYKDTVYRTLHHIPCAGYPTLLKVAVRRYRCTGCQTIWRQDLTRAAGVRACLTKEAIWWAIARMVLDKMSISALARNLGVCWDTLNTAVLSHAQQVLFNDPQRLEGVRVLGVDEHCWRHVPGKQRFVTVIIDLTPVAERRGKAHLLEVIEGRSRRVFEHWLATRPDEWAQGVEIVAMDGFTGFKTAATNQLPQAKTVMDPFHVVRLGGNAMDKCRQPIQRETLGRRGRKNDPLFKARRLLLTRTAFLSERGWQCLQTLFATDAHVAVEVTWQVYQRLLAAYQHPKPAQGKRLMQALITTLSKGVPRELQEVGRLGKTLNARSGDVLAYFDYPHTSNGPTEAINGRLEHLRGIALGFRNLTHYIARCLLQCGGFEHALHR